MTEEQPGEWWTPITSAPTNGQRIMLALPQIMRPRLPHEKKQKLVEQPDGTFRRNTEDVKQFAPSVTLGCFVKGKWMPGRHAKAPFDPEPTHWMYMPDLPDEYMAS